MQIELESMAIEMPLVAGHPNREGFRGVLTLVDVASDRPPAGARGHRVLLTRRAAEAALASLLGMGLDYAPSLDRHDARRKVGVITRADIVERQLELGGYLFAKDFPEIVREIGRPAHAGRPSRFDFAASREWPGRGLGMSYEIAFAGRTAGRGVWHTESRGVRGSRRRVVFSGVVVAVRSGGTIGRARLLSLSQAQPDDFDTKFDATESADPGGNSQSVPARRSSGGCKANRCNGIARGFSSHAAH